jgi:hypothetical protein
VLGVWRFRSSDRNIRRQHSRSLCNKSKGWDVKLREFWIKPKNLMDEDEPVTNSIRVREVSPELDAAWAQCEDVLEIYALTESGDIAMRALAVLKKARE